MNKADLAKIQTNIGSLIEVTRWNDQLEEKLLETKVFTRKEFIDQLKVKEI